MKLGEKQEIFTLNVAKLIIFANEKGFKARIREVQRTPEQQNIYLKNGLSKTKNSKHLDSLAVDLYFSKDGEIVLNIEELAVLGKYWESLDKFNKWGGHFDDFKDCPHFEYRG